MGIGNWSPTGVGAGYYYNQMISDAHELGVQSINVQFGTNDAIGVAEFRTQLAMFSAAVISEGFKVYLHTVPFCSVIENDQLVHANRSALYSATIIDLATKGDVLFPTLIPGTNIFPGDKIGAGLGCLS